jgi:hypothetical protein
MQQPKEKAARCNGRHDASVSWIRHRKHSGAPRGWFVVRGWACECEVCESSHEGPHFESWALNSARVRLVYAPSGRLRIVSDEIGQHFYIEPEEPPELVVKRWRNALSHAEVVA